MYEHDANEHEKAPQLDSQATTRSKLLEDLHVPSNSPQKEINQAKPDKTFLPELTIDKGSLGPRDKSDEPTKETSKPRETTPEKPLAEPGTKPDTKSGDQPIIDTSIEVSGKVIRREWTSGPHKGEKEYQSEDGGIVHYTPDGKSGETVVATDAKGNRTTSHTRPDGKGGAILDYEDPSNPRKNYTAHYSADGKMTVDFADGRHMERTKTADGTTVITMKGPEEYQNYVATKTPDNKLHVAYADGSSFDSSDNGAAKVHGKYGGLGILDTLLPSASDHHFAAEWEIISSYWLSRNESVGDVKRHDQRLYSPN